MEHSRNFGAGFFLFPKDKRRNNEQNIIHFHESPFPLAGKNENCKIENTTKTRNFSFPTITIKEVTNTIK